MLVLQALLASLKAQTLNGGWSELNDKVEKKVINSMLEKIGSNQTVLESLSSELG